MKWNDISPKATFLYRTATGWAVAAGDSLAETSSLKGAIALAERFEKTGHVYSDESVIGHCVFCGSGDVVSRSDGTVECQLCHRGFVVMEQPLHSAQPAPDYQSMQIDGTGIEEEVGDPIEEAPAFAPPPEADVVPPAQAGMPKKDDPPLKTDAAVYRTDRGFELDRESFVRHVAIKFARVDAQ